MPACSHLNPLTPKILLIILLTISHKVLVMLVWRIWHWITNNPQIAIFFFILITHLVDIVLIL